MTVKNNKLDGFIPTPAGVPSAQSRVDGGVAGVDGPQDVSDPFKDLTTVKSSPQANTFSDDLNDPRADEHHHAQQSLQSWATEQRNAPVLRVADLALPKTFKA